MDAECDDLEACETPEERAWYLNAALEHGWGKTELLRQIQNGAWGLHRLDEPEDICYTEEKETVTECGEREKDLFVATAISVGAQWPSMS